jgi:RNA polymerase sigma-70 factor (ECF subfamily)
MENISWTQTQKQLIVFIYKRVKDHAVAEDITQEVLIKVFSKMTQLQEPDRLSGWIYQIARNSITDYFRNKSRELSVRDLDWESDDRSLNACVETCLKDLLQTLPEPYREALELVELGSLSQHALADKLGISYSGAKSRVQRARLMLKEQMDKNYLIRMDSYGNVVECKNKMPCNCTRDIARN